VNLALLQQFFSEIVKKNLTVYEVNVLKSNCAFFIFAVLVV